MKSRLWAAARVALGVSLLAVLLATTDLSGVAQAFVDGDPRWVLGVLVMPHLGILISAYKWRYLLRSVNVPVGLWAAFRLYMVGTFFSNFLPSVVGGDVVRAYILGARERDHVGVVAATFAERATGLAALGLLVPISLFEQRIAGPFGAYIAGSLLIMWIVAITAGIVLLRRSAGEPASEQPGLVGRVRHFVLRGLARLRQFDRRALAFALAVSFPFYLTAMLSVYAAGRAVGVELEPWTLLACVPVVLFVALVPISLNGLGVSEVGWVVALGLFGVAEPTAVALGLLLRARQVLTACAGGFMYLSFRRSGATPDANPRR